jgi:Ni2+-binding GTPase involved in maturation of urease and hydrogenase
VEAAGIAAQYSRELADFTIYIIDVAAGRAAQGRPGHHPVRPPGDQQD